MHRTSANLENTTFGLRMRRIIHSGCDVLLGMRRIIRDALGGLRKKNPQPGHPLVKISFKLLK